MKTIKNIVVATDFSVTSKNAYHYACQLANALNAIITVVHVQEHLIVISDVIIVPLPSENDKEVIKNMEEFLADENTSANSAIIEQNVIMKIVAGNPDDILIGLSENDSTDLIIMGTTGLSDVLTKLFGSTSQKVANKAHCPVILVPRDVKWNGIEQLAFASNYDSMTPNLVHHITDFAVNVKSDVHFVNVRNFDPVFEAKQKEVDWNELFVSAGADLNFEKHTIYGNDTIEQLQKYSKDKNIDLMVFVSKHRNFWESLVHKSLTENMAISGATIPMMVMHVDDNV
jgi:nucleotide-binding universal stress UspA family protein